MKYRKSKNNKKQLPWPKAKVKKRKRANTLIMPIMFTIPPYPKPLPGGATRLTYGEKRFVWVDQNDGAQARPKKRYGRERGEKAMKKYRRRNRVMKSRSIHVRNVFREKLIQQLPFFPGP